MLKGVKIILTNDITETNLIKLMTLDFDMVCQRNLDNDKINHIIKIYNIINNSNIYSN
jgi:hypothetical protein